VFGRAPRYRLAQGQSRGDIGPYAIRRGPGASELKQQGFYHCRAEGWPLRRAEAIVFAVPWGCGFGATLESLGRACRQDHDRRHQPVDLGYVPGAWSYRFPPAKQWARLAPGATGGQGLQTPRGANNMVDSRLRPMASLSCWWPVTIPRPRRGSSRLRTILGFEGGRRGSARDEPLSSNRWRWCGSSFAAWRRKLGKELRLRLAAERLELGRGLASEPASAGFPRRVTHGGNPGRRISAT